MMIIVEEDLLCQGSALLIAPSQETCGHGALRQQQKPRLQPAHDDSSYSSSSSRRISTLRLLNIALALIIRHRLLDRRRRLLVLWRLLVLDLVHLLLVVPRTILLLLLSLAQQNRAVLQVQMPCGAAFERLLRVSAPFLRLAQPRSLPLLHQLLLALQRLILAELAARYLIALASAPQALLVAWKLLAEPSSLQ